MSLLVVGSGYLLQQPSSWPPFIRMQSWGSEASPDFALTHWGRNKMAAIFPDDILIRIFFNENVWIPIEMSLKFVPKGPINNIPALVQIMAWRWQGDKPLSEPMVVWLSTHICVTRPQWDVSLLNEKRSGFLGLLYTNHQIFILWGICKCKTLWWLSTSLLKLS